MNNLIKTGTIGMSFVIMPSLYMNAESFENKQKGLEKQTKSELYINLKNDSSDNIYNNWNRESISLNEIELKEIDKRVVINAVMNYFDEEVKKFKISTEARQKISNILNLYLENHSILKISDTGEVIFYIDDKQEFSSMIKQFTNIIIDDMPFLIRKIVLPLFLGGNDAIQQKLDNLDSTTMNMKENQYKVIIFDCIAGIVKRSVISVNGNMKVGNYFNSINGYYPNRNSNNISRELERLGLLNQDIKDFRYPY